MLPTFKVSVQHHHTPITYLRESEQLTYWVSHIRVTRTQHHRSSLTACLKLKGISPWLIVIPSQIRSCLTTCMTTRALARLHVLCMPHASPLLSRRASAVPVESQGSRTHTTQPPLRSITDHHRPMTSFTLPSDHWAPVQITCHSLFPKLK